MAVIGVGTTSRVSVEDLLALIRGARVRLSGNERPPHSVSLPPERPERENARIFPSVVSPSPLGRPLRNGTTSSWPHLMRPSRAKKNAIDQYAEDGTWMAGSSPAMTKIRFEKVSLGERAGVRGEFVRDEAITLTAIATLARPGSDEAVRRAAVHLGLELILLSLDQLEAVAHLCVTRSEKSMERYCIPSVAEAAALAAAGKDAHLILPRFCGRNTTASVAA